MIQQIIGGTFDDHAHIYRDPQGNYVPSLTQILTLTGLSNFFNGNAEVRENAMQRGSDVHACIAMYARYGEIDPTWRTPQLDPYIDAALKFYTEIGFVPDPDFVEQPMIAKLRGYKYGVTADVIGNRQYSTVVELKCSDGQFQPAWAIQLSGQAVARFGEHRGQAVQRWVVQLKSDGRYKVTQCDDHAGDLAVFQAALMTVHWRLRNGQRLWEVQNGY